MVELHIDPSSPVDIYIQPSALPTGSLPGDLIAIRPAHVGKGKAKDRPLLYKVEEVEAVSKTRRGKAQVLVSASAAASFGWIKSRTDVTLTLVSKISSLDNLLDEPFLIVCHLSGDCTSPTTIDSLSCRTVLLRCLLISKRHDATFPISVQHLTILKSTSYSTWIGRPFTNRRNIQSRPQEGAKCMGGRRHQNYIQIRISSFVRFCRSEPGDGSL